MVRPRSRRGQTLVIAIAILFLLAFLAAIFITSIIRNLQRTGRTGETEDSLTLALAGIQHAAQQFRTSELGADWRPEPAEALWKTPAPPAGISVPVTPPHPRFGNTLDGAELRQLDPDYEWLSDNGSFNHPFVRFPTGGGRYLLRVTYLPMSRHSSRTAEEANLRDVFDPSTMLIHIEAIGRSGEVDTNDPASLAFDATAARGESDATQYRKLDAYVPIGIADQLWWVSNRTKEKGPAQLGVAPFRDGTGRLVTYPTVFEGGIRSDVDVEFVGRNVIKLYPARGETLTVKGSFKIAPAANTDPAVPTTGLIVEALDDNGDASAGRVIPPNQDDDNPDNDSLIVPPINNIDSDDPNFDALAAYASLLDSGGLTRPFVLDDRYLRTAATDSVRSARLQPPPTIDQKDATTNIPRWYLVTRDSGHTLEVDDGGKARLVNTGWYGLTDNSLKPELRARGLYLDNFGDVQYPIDRRAVTDEWLQRGSADVRKRGWLGEYYVPSVPQQGSPLPLPVSEAYLTYRLQDPNNASSPKIPVIRITRWDFDLRGMNLAPSTGRQRLFYDLRPDPVDPTKNILVAVGTTRDFDYPSNGIFYAEGSLRIRGSVGSADFPKRLTVVSGGTIYIEGNLVKGSPASALGLIAQDYVTVNPTAFTRLRPGQDVDLEPEALDTNGQPSGYHFSIPQGSTLDFTTASAEPGASSMLLLKHSAPIEDARSNTAVTLFRPRLDPRPSAQLGWPGAGPPPAGNLDDRYDFGAFPPDGVRWGTPPPTPPATGYSAGSQMYYLFRQLSAGDFRDAVALDPINWAESAFQSVAGAGSPANHERKAFFIPEISSDGVGAQPGQDITFRMSVGADPRVGTDGQPYWLSRIAMVPKLQDGPLKIRIDAVVYAYTGSFFVIPPPFFNDNPDDSRQLFENPGPRQGLRAVGTFPRNTADAPFYHEPLNIDIQFLGAITENMPVDAAGKARWIDRTWRNIPGYDPAAFPATSPGVYRPNIRFRYDANLRRWARIKILRTGQEGLAWVAPGPMPMATDLAKGVARLDEWMAYARSLQDANGNVIGSYVETYPVLPGLPASTVVYEGSTL